MKKQIALICVFVLLMPSALQMLHSFGEGKHPICISKKLHHFHKQHLSCDILHFQLNTFNPSNSSEYTFFTTHFYTRLSSFKSQCFKAVYRSKKSSRAPPFFII